MDYLQIKTKHQTPKDDYIVHVSAYYVQVSSQYVIVPSCYITINIK